MKKLKQYQVITIKLYKKTATAEKQIPIASFIPIYMDVAAAKSNKRFMPCKQRSA
ncbi:hypothetical protein [Shewanella xiamenensis]|uniref:Arm DNA-binding domain-containing protein n=1 Tax=Shewanella xiamenensis TaxID=332186 RepID=A0ABT6UEJ3_9GAMM|nr:hypothetical protein [Shewanella xiamenensis]MDI5832896.1 hypothetical protein [Shewanella xiamenensis]